MNFRKIKTKSGKLVLAGRDAETNEELIKQAGKDEIVLHTKAPGSPFVNIKAEGTSNKISKKDIHETAIFCAKYSQAWKKPKSKPDKIEVHYFLGKNIFKTPGMKLGTFLVKKFKRIIVKKEEIEDFK